MACTCTVKPLSTIINHVHISFKIDVHGMFIVHVHVAASTTAFKYGMEPLESTVFQWKPYKDWILVFSIGTDDLVQ